MSDDKTAPAFWLKDARKGQPVVVRIKDKILCGKYRRDGTYWFTVGTIEHVSRQYGYLQVTFEDIWQHWRRNWLFHLDSGLSNDYSQGWECDPRNRVKITLRGSTDEYTLLPYYHIRYLEVIKRQKMIEFLTREQWDAWECLTTEQLQDLIKRLFQQDTREIPWDKIRNSMWLALTRWQEYHHGIPVSMERLAEEVYWDWNYRGTTFVREFPTSRPFSMDERFYRLAQDVIQDYEDHQRTYKNKEGKETPIS